MRLLRSFALPLLGACLLASAALADDRGSDALDPVAAREWSAEVLDLAARLPVQDGGRLKPLSTAADFSLLRINHKRTLRDADGNKSTAMRWLWNALFYPEAASREDVFLIENHDVLDAIGVAHDEKKRRDRYAYAELYPARPKLLQLAHEYSQIDEKRRNPVQGQMIHLAENFLEFEGFLYYLNFARADVPVPETLRPLFGGHAQATVTEVLFRLPEATRKDGAATAALHDKLTQYLGGAHALALFPPIGDSDAWMTPRDLLGFIRRGHEVPPTHLDLLARLQAMVAVRDDPGKFREHLQAFHAGAAEAAHARGAYDKIESEVSFYRLDPFTKSLMLYLAAFLLVAASWVKRGRWVLRAAWVLLGAGLALTTTGVVWRCILRSRPPVSTLYETVLFITAIAVGASLVIEAINRRRIALAAAPILGVLGMFIAARFEEINRADTMPRLVAVLDTNFWLATHVTCITIGYAAGLLAAAIAHVHLLGRALGFKRDDASFYRNIGKMVYGITCFALLFAVVGTILGGVWANESWGRFWGWDPKENGALLIVLAQLALLHGRMGGYLRDHGVCMAAVLGGGVVAFSWWGVNLLGVGLHSYGFTEGVWTGLGVFYALEALVLLLGAVTWMRLRGMPPAAAA